MAAEAPAKLRTASDRLPASPSADTGLAAFDNSRKSGRAPGAASHLRVAPKPLVNEVPTRAKRLNAFSPALLASLAIHGAIAGVLVMLVAAGGSGRGQPFAGIPIQATLASPPVTFVVPKQEPVHTALPAAPEVTKQAAVDQPVATAPMFTPPASRRPAPAEGTLHGRVVINEVDPGTPVEPAMQQMLQRIYPGAVRVQLAFEDPMSGTYPAAALKQRRQMQVAIVAIVLEDGSLELAHGTYEDPLFAPAVRAALATARVQPPLVNGQPVKGWSVLDFTFEFMGAAE